MLARVVVERDTVHRTFCLKKQGATQALQLNPRGAWVPFLWSLQAERALGGIY